MPQGKGTYGKKVGRPAKKKTKKKVAKKKVAKKKSKASAAKAKRKRVTQRNAAPFKSMTEHINDEWGIAGKILTPRLTATEWMLSKTNPKKKKKKTKKK